MATTATESQGKTSFVKEFLQGNPQAKAKAVNEAWTGCRDERDDQSPRHQLVRKQLGLTGNLRGKTKKPPRKRQPPTCPGRQPLLQAKPAS